MLSSSPSRSLPLSQIRVLDLTRLLPGPLAAAFLGDLGADVVKVEPLEGDPTRSVPPLLDGESVLFRALNRNKRSVAIDLGRPEGTAALRRLAARADVLLESFRPGRMREMELDDQRLRLENPGLVYASLSGFGATGPLRDRAGHDLAYEALAGLLTPNTHDPAPRLPRTPVADVAGGAWHATCAVVAALFSRSCTGNGAWLDVSVFDGAVASAPVAFANALGGRDPGQPAELTGALPNYGLYRTKDGGWFALAALEPKFWEIFCTTIRRPDLIPAPFAGEAERGRLGETLRQLFLSRSKAEWISLFEGTDACVAPVLSPAETAAHPQTKARHLILEDERGRSVAPPFVFDGARLPLRRPAPRLGEHTGEALREAGFSDDEIRELVSSGVAYGGGGNSPTLRR